MTEETLCLCGCSSRVHTKMNQKSWDRLNKQMEGYNDNEPSAREKFWNEFLTSGSSDEWRCSECDCGAFKMNNLKYLEERYKDKKKCQ